MCSLLALCASVCRQGQGGAGEFSVPQNLSGPRLAEAQPSYDRGSLSSPREALGLTRQGEDPLKRLTQAFKCFDWKATTAGFLSQPTGQNESHDPT